MRRFSPSLTTKLFGFGLISLFLGVEWHTFLFVSHNMYIMLYSQHGVSALSTGCLLYTPRYRVKLCKSKNCTSYMKGWDPWTNCLFLRSNFEKSAILITWYGNYAWHLEQILDINFKAWGVVSHLFKVVLNLNQIL